MKEKPMPSYKESQDERIRKTYKNVKLHKEPANSMSCLLTAAMYLKLKKRMFNEGTQVEAATQFNVKSKVLAQILSGKCYWDGKARKAAAERKSIESTCIYSSQATGVGGNSAHKEEESSCYQQ